LTLLLFAGIGLGYFLFNCFFAAVGEGFFWIEFGLPLLLLTGRPLGTTSYSSSSDDDESSSDSTTGIASRPAAG